MFEVGNKIYTEEDIYIKNDVLVFEAYKSYTVYDTNEDGMIIPCLIGESGHLHDVKTVEHMFKHQH